MKQIAFLLLSGMLMLTSCNNNKPGDTATITSSDGKEKITVDPKQMQDAVMDMEKQKDELSKLSPLSMDQLKAMIPEILMSAKRTNYEANTAMGASVATGEYELNDSTRITLNIYDCAGPAGAGIYGLQYLGLLNVQQENDEEFTKSIDFNGGKAFEQCDKTTNDCTFTYFSGGRFLVTLEGEHIGIDALMQAAKGLNIK